MCGHSGAHFTFLSLSHLTVDVHRFRLPLMQTQISTTEQANGELLMTLKAANGNVLKYGAGMTGVEEVIDGKVFTTTEQDAVRIAAEMQSLGVTEARAFGYAVVFWS